MTRLTADTHRDLARGLYTEGQEGPSVTREVTLLRAIYHILVAIYESMPANNEP